MSDHLLPKTVASLNIIGLLLTYPLSVTIVELVLQIRGKRLNRYFIWKKHERDVYLVHLPRTLFYYSTKPKYRANRQEALAILRRRFPQYNVASITTTLQNDMEQQGKSGKPVRDHFWRRVGHYMLILLNIRTYWYRKLNRLFRRVDLNRPKKYIIRRRVR